MEHLPRVTLRFRDDDIGYVRYKPASIDVSSEYMSVIREAGWVEARKVSQVLGVTFRGVSPDVTMVSVEDLRVLGIIVTDEESSLPNISSVGAVSGYVDRSAADFFGK